MKTEINAICLFIAELTGSFKAGSGTQEDKIECGKNGYVSNHLPKLDLTDEEDRKELNELMWLERLYAELDDYFSIAGDSLSRRLSFDTENYREAGYKFNVPIELDASASILQIAGVLLNDKRMLEMTNVIGTTLKDPWYLEGIPRAMLKEAATPSLIV